MNTDCLRNLTKEEIFKKFGDDDFEKCSKCDHLKYQNGIMTCDICFQNTDGKEN